MVDKVAHGLTDAAQLATLALSGGLIVVGATPQPLSEAQVIAVASGAGLFGGFVHALMDDVDWHWREYLKRVLASGMVAPAIVVLAIVYVLPSPSLLPVVAAAGPAGIVAYPIARMLPRLAPKAFRRWLAKAMGEDS